MSILNLELSSALASDIGWTLVHFLWQGMALAALLEAVLPLCRSASARHNWALAILAAMVAAPLVTFLVLYHASANAPIPAMTASLPAMTVVQAATPASMPVPWTGWLVACWLAGIALLSMRALGGLALTRNLRRGSFALPDDLLRRCHALQARLRLRAAVRFAETRAVTVPIVVGWLRPMVLIPVAAIAGLPPQQLDALILHELAHISRLDAFTNLFLMLAETVLFYHPAIWWVSRRIRIEREHCCDDVAVAHSGDVTTYVEALTALEMGRAMPVFALSARGGLLKARVARLLDVPQTRRNPAPAASLVAAALIAAGIVLPALAQPKPGDTNKATMWVNAARDLTITETSDGKDVNAPIKMTSDDLEYHPGRIVTGNGNVVITKGGLELHADSARGENTDGKDGKFTLDGNVVVTNAGKTFHGSHAVVEMQERAIQIKMSPVLSVIVSKQGANAVEGQKSAGPTSFFSVITDQGTVLVQVDVQKLAANGLTLNALPGVITRHGRLRSIDDIAHIVLAYKNGGPVFVSTIANLAYSAPDGEPVRKHAEAPASHSPVREADAAASGDGTSAKKLDRQVAQVVANPATRTVAPRVNLIDGQLAIEREQLQEAQRQHVIISPPDMDRAMLKTVPHPKVDSLVQPIARPAPAPSPAPLPRTTGFIPAAQNGAKIQPIMETHTLPPYPAKSAKLKEQGKVDLAVTIGTNGAVARARIGKSSGHPALDTAAAQYVKSHWRWQPPTRNGKPVTVTTDVAVVFKLNPPERAPQPATP